MTAKGSVTSMILNDKLFDTVLDCCQKNGDIRYSNKEKMIIAGKSFYGPQRNEGEIDFQVLLSENPCTIEVYEYCKRGIDRKFMERVIDALLPILGRDVNVKIEDLDRCGICKKRLKLGTPRHIPSIGWATCYELCQSCFDLLLQHEKNYCCVCQKKLGFRRYSAKISWNRNLMLCKQCYYIHKRPSNSENGTVLSGAKLLENSVKSDIFPSIIGKEDPLHILKIRFAKGEINKDDYVEMKKTLEQ